MSSRTIGDELNNEREKLEYAIADLLKVGEVHKGKMKNIKGICDEHDAIEPNSRDLVG